MARREPAYAIPVYETSIEEVFYPEITVQLGDLRGPEGNAYVILGRTKEALKRAGVDPNEYWEAATSGDYDHLLFVTRTFVRVLETGPGLPQDQ